MVEYKVKEFLKYLDGLEIYAVDEETSKKLKDFLDLPVYYDEENEKYFLKNDLGYSLFLNIKNDFKSSEGINEFLKIEIINGNYLFLSYRREEYKFSESYDSKNIYIFYFLNLKNFEYKKLAPEIGFRLNLINYSMDVDISELCHIYDNYFISNGVNLTSEDYLRTYYFPLKIDIENLYSNGWSVTGMDIVDSEEFIKNLELNKINLEKSFKPILQVLGSLYRENLLKTEYIKKLINKDTSKYYFSEEIFNFICEYLDQFPIREYIKDNFIELFDKKYFEYNKKTVENLLENYREYIGNWFDDSIKDIDDRLYTICLNILNEKIIDLRKCDKNSFRNKRKIKKII